MARMLDLNLKRKSRRIETLVILVGVIGLAAPAGAINHDVTWAVGVSQPAIMAVVGDTVTFNYGTGHTVEEFPDMTAFLGCDFASAALIQGTGPAVVPLNTPGTFYYGCGVGSHCASGGMSLEVVVSAAPAVPGANPYLVVVALALAGLLTIRTLPRSRVV